MSKLNSKIARAVLMSACTLPEQSKRAFLNILGNAVMSTADTDGRLSAMVYTPDMGEQRTWLLVEQDVNCISGVEAKVTQAAYANAGDVVYMDVYIHTNFEIQTDRVASKGGHLIALYTNEVVTITDKDKLGGWLAEYNEQTYVSSIREALHADIDKSKMSKNIVKDIKDITDVFLSDLHRKLEIPSNGLAYQYIGEPHAFIKQVVFGIVVNPLTGLRMAVMIAYTLSGTFIFHSHDDGDGIYHGAFHSRYAQHVHCIK